MITISSLQGAKRRFIAKSMQITMYILLAVSMFAVTIASPIFDREQEKIFEAVLQHMDAKRQNENEVKSLEGDHGQLSQYSISKKRQDEAGDIMQREVKRKQVGDRRLKCVLYDTQTKKCLRHKMSFLWGRR